MRILRAIRRDLLVEDDFFGFFDLEGGAFNVVREVRLEERLVLHMVWCLERIHDLGQWAAELSEQQLQPLETAGIEWLACRACARHRAGYLPRASAEQRSDQAVEPLELRLPAKFDRDLPCSISQPVELSCATQMKKLFESLFELLDREHA